MTRRTPILGLLALFLAAPLGPALAEVKASFRYPLANFSGPVPSIWARLAVDQERGEVYVLDPRGNDIRIFDEHGMEIFVFGDGVASAADITIGEGGDIYVLTTGYQASALHLLNYRGEHVSEIPLQNLPAEFPEFVADRILYQRGSLYLVDSNRMLVIVVDERGYFEETHDLRPIVRPVLSREGTTQWPLQDVDRIKKKLEYTDISGFTVDARGNLFFTVGTLFTAFVVSPDGETREFGRPGSGPGKFGIASGIAVDDAGYIYVTDKLRSVVLVFDPNLEFQTEFGYRGDRPSSLIVPDDLAIDASGNLYIGQAANRGVSVFRVVHETASPSQGIDTDSMILEEPARVTEEEFLSAREEFIADQQADPSEDNLR